jgi:hypothetical protein
MSGSLRVVASNDFSNCGKPKARPQRGSASRLCRDSTEGKTSRERRSGTLSRKMGNQRERPADRHDEFLVEDGQSFADHL